MGFVHLHVHSSYSLLQGAMRPAELVEAAARMSAKAVALTDTNGLYGAVVFYEAAREAGLKPIIGAELVHGRAQCVCLAADRTGYANLCRIVSERRLTGTPHAKSFLGAGGGYDLAESVAAHYEGLFVLSATPALLAQLKGRVPDGRLYTELRADSPRSFECDCSTLNGVHGQEDENARAVSAADAAARLRIPLAATVNVNFLRPEDRETHAVLSAIRENRSFHGICAEQRMLAGPRSFLQSPEQVAARLPGARDAMENTLRIADACCLSLEPDGPRFPRYDRLPDGQTACSCLREAAYRGARERYGRITAAVRERLERELDVIAKLGFSDYFLVVWDIAEFARRQGIPHVGRGSAANSIVSYCLGISAVDPLKFDLYFERFLNEFRTDVPDIDMDFCWRRRDEVIDYVYRRHPSGQVAMVSTHTTLRARSALRDVARVMGLPMSDINRCCAVLPYHDVSAVEEAAQAFPEAARFPADREPWRSILAHARKIDGYVRHLGIHLGGMVIGDRPLTHYTALQDSAKGIVITQYEMSAVERTGLVKIDLLGQRSLTLVSEAAAAVKRNHGVRIDIDGLPDRDGRTSALLRRGRTMGCFQIESPGMRQLLQMVKAESIMDVIQALSLIRPGPSGSGMKDAFIRRKRGQESVTYLAPQMEEALRQTYGVMLYQEDILKVSQAVAGFSMAVGDELRKRITKARSAEALLELRGRFLDGARERGLPPEVAAEIWKQVESFAAYSYCKAHATTYGHISWQAAWLKAHYPAEFLAAVIANKGGFYDAGAYYRDARRFNVPILPPSANESEVECVAVPLNQKSEILPAGRLAGKNQKCRSAVRPGLEHIRSLSARTVKQILQQRAARPFESLEDFCNRVRLTRQELDNLILCGAFDWAGLTRPTLMARAELQRPAVRDQGAGSSRASSLQPQAPSLPLEPSNRKLARRSLGKGGSEILPAGRLAGENLKSLFLPEFSLRDRVRYELSILGMTHSGHPLDAFDGALDARGTTCSFELPRRVGRRVTFIGWLVMMRHAVTHNHEYMKFLCLEDRHGMVEVAVFPDAYRRCGRQMADWGAYRVEGIVKEQHGALSLVAEQAEALPPAAPP